MQLIAPVTDYIPASLMTTDGDMVSRRDGQPAREQPYGYGNVKQSRGAGVNLGNTLLVGVLDTYLKGQGGASPAIFQALALRDTGIFINADTRNSSGNEVISGVGFQPSMVIAFATESTSTERNYSLGFSNNVNPGRTFYQYDTGSNMAITTSLVYVRRTAGNLLFAVVASFDADGFTIDWTLTGAMTVDWFYLCLP